MNPMSLVIMDSYAGCVTSPHTPLGRRLRAHSLAFRLCLQSGTYDGVWIEELTTIILRSLEEGTPLHWLERQLRSQLGLPW